MNDGDFQYREVKIDNHYMPHFAFLNSENGKGLIRN